MRASCLRRQATCLSFSRLISTRFVVFTISARSLCLCIIAVSSCVRTITLQPDNDASSMLASVLSLKPMISSGCLSDGGDSGGVLASDDSREYPDFSRGVADPECRLVPKRRLAPLEELEELPPDCPASGASDVSQEAAAWDGTMDVSGNTGSGSVSEMCSGNWDGSDVDPDIAFKA